jgi:hypothetical protein
MNYIFVIFIFILSIISLVTGFLPMLILFFVLWLILMVGMGFAHWCDKK